MDPHAHQEAGRAAQDAVLPDLGGDAAVVVVFHPGGGGHEDVLLLCKICKGIAQAAAHFAQRAGGAGHHPLHALVPGDLHAADGHGPLGEHVPIGEHCQLRPIQLFGSRLVEQGRARCEQLFGNAHPRRGSGQQQPCRGQHGGYDRQALQKALRPALAKRGHRRQSHCCHNGQRRIDAAKPHGAVRRIDAGQVRLRRRLGFIGHGPLLFVLFGAHTHRRRAQNRGFVGAAQHQQPAPLGDHRIKQGHLGHGGIGQGPRRLPHAPHAVGQGGKCGQQHHRIQGGTQPAQAVNAGQQYIAGRQQRKRQGAAHHQRIELGHPFIPDHRGQRDRQLGQHRCRHPDGQQQKQQNGPDAQPLDFFPQVLNGVGDVVRVPFEQKVIGDRLFFFLFFVVVLVQLLGRRRGGWPGRLGEFAHFAPLLFRPFAGRRSFGRRLFLPAGFPLLFVRRRVGLFPGFFFPLPLFRLPLLHRQAAGDVDDPAFAQRHFFRARLFFFVCGRLPLRRGLLLFRLAEKRGVCLPLLRCAQLGIFEFGDDLIHRIFSVLFARSFCHDLSLVLSQAFAQCLKQQHSRCIGCVQRRDAPFLRDAHHKIALLLDQRRHPCALAANDDGGGQGEIGFV